MDSGQWFIDLVNILSLVVGLENLELNQNQVNDLMAEMRNNQNSMLATIIEQNEEIIKLLKEGNNAQGFDKKDS